jgi:hypothetical protein
MEFLPVENVRVLVVVFRLHLVNIGFEAGLRALGVDEQKGAHHLGIPLAGRVIHAARPRLHVNLHEPLHAEERAVDAPIRARPVNRRLRLRRRGRLSGGAARSRRHGQNRQTPRNPAREKRMRGFHIRPPPHEIAVNLRKSGIRFPRPGPFSHKRGAKARESVATRPPFRGAFAPERNGRIRQTRTFQHSLVRFRE